LQRYIVRRVAALAATLVFVSLLVFAVVRVLPGDPALIILGLEANADSVARVRQELGLDRPIAVQYAQWVGRALRGDLGRSIQYDLPVSTLILTRLTVTLPLTLLAAGLMIAAAIPLGVFAATRHRRWGDYLTMTLSQLGVAVPGFWAGLLLILFFSVYLGWVRAGGFDGWGQGFWPALRSLLMPAAALGLFQFAVLARTTRSAVLEVLREEYVKTARAKGLAERRVLFRHALRNALIPTVTIVGLQFGTLLGGAVIVETVFARQGLGRMIVTGILQKDFPSVQGAVLVTTLIYVVLARNSIIFAHNIVGYVIIAAICGVALGWQTLLLIPGLALVLVNCAWMCLLVAILCLRYRDFQQLIASLLQIAVFVTPVFWEPAMLQGKRAVIVDVNLLHHMVELIRQPLLGKVPSALSWGFCIAFALAGWILTFWLFSRKRHRLAYWF